MNDTRLILKALAYLVEQEYEKHEYGTWQRESGYKIWSELANKLSETKDD